MMSDDNLITRSTAETAVEIAMHLSYLNQQGKFNFDFFDSDLERDDMIVEWAEELENSIYQCDIDCFGYYEIVEDYVENKFLEEKQEKIKEPFVFGLDRLEEWTKTIQYYNQHCNWKKKESALTDKEEIARKEFFKLIDIFNLYRHQFTTITEFEDKQQNEEIK